MNRKTHEAVEKLSKHLREKDDSEGLFLLSQLLAALNEGQDDVLRKTK
jgi:hypothetical protein